MRIMTGDVDAREVTKEFVLIERLVVLVRKPSLLSMIAVACKLLAMLMRMTSLRAAGGGG